MDRGPGGGRGKNVLLEKQALTRVIHEAYSSRPDLMMAQPREGDWYCPTCKDLQFERNTICRRCGTPNPKTQSQWPLAKLGNHSNHDESDRAWKRARKEYSLTRYHVDVPEDRVDMDFIRQIFGKGSTYPSHLRDETSCQYRLEPSRHRMTIMIEGDEQRITDAIAKVKSLFRASSTTQEALLEKFTNARWRAGFDAISDSSAGASSAGAPGGQIVPMSSSLPPPPPPATKFTDASKKRRDSCPRRGSASPYDT